MSTDTNTNATIGEVFSTPGGATMGQSISSGSATMGASFNVNVVTDPTPPSGLDPESLASLTHLLDARTLALSDGANVDTWTAKVGTSATQASSGATTYSTDALDGVSGAHAVSFAGSRGMDWPINESETTWSLMILFSALDDADGYLADRSGTSRFVPTANFSTSGYVAAIWDGTTVHPLSRAYDDGDTHLMVISCDASAGEMSVWVDGVLELDAVSYAPSAWSSNVALGAQNNETSNPYAGDIGGVWYFDADALTSSEADDILIFERDSWSLALDEAATLDANSYGTVVTHWTAEAVNPPDATDVGVLADVTQSGNTFTAPAVSNRATWSAANARLDFDGSDFYRGSSSTPYDTMHQTPEGTVVARFVPTTSSSGSLQTIFSTCAFSTSATGVNVTIDDRVSAPASNTLRFFVSRGVGGTSVYDTLSAAIAASLSTGVATVLAFAWDATDVRLYQDGALLGSDAPSANPPSASAASALPEIGASNGSFQFEEGLTDVVVFTNKLDATAIANITTAIEAQYP